MNSPVDRPVVLIAEELAPSAIEVLADDFDVRHVDGTDRLALLAALADRLDDAHMQVLECRFLDDMTQDEIAEHLGVSRKTVGKRLDRIRAAATELRGEEAS